MAVAAGSPVVGVCNVQSWNSVSVTSTSWQARKVACSSACGCSGSSRVPVGSAGAIRVQGREFYAGAALPLFALTRRLNRRTEIDGNGARVKAACEADPVPAESTSATNNIWLSDVPVTKRGPHFCNTKWNERVSRNERVGRVPVAGIVASLSSLLATGAAAAEGFLDENVTSVNSSNFAAVAAIVQGLPLAELNPDTAQLLIYILGPVFASLNLLFILRIVMSWYPALPVGKFPFVIAYAPTEPVLEPTRRLFRPVGGVDISPIIWVAGISFLNEILLGQQGLLVLLSQEQF